MALPFQDPVVVFGITMLVILVVPFIFSKLKLPGIIGLIISGMLLGSSGFNVLQSEGSIELLGNVGLMYLMFLAGLELDLNTFIKNRNSNLLFGFLTFAIPFVLGFVICRYVLAYNLLQSMLVASMFSTQTLIAYPIVSRLRLTKTKPVSLAIGGTIITDTLVLFLLIVILALQKGESSIEFWSGTMFMVLCYMLFMFYIFPRVVRWFFRNTSTDIMAQYVFVLAMVFIAGILAKVIHLEPIIGAFLSGIVLNKQIPHSSKLMNRVSFVGNAIFIPFFLLYVGMLINIRAFAAGWDTLKLSLVLIAVALVSKWIAAYITQKLFRFRHVERKLIFGLSTAHAAATIAIILIGFKMGIANDSILNASIMVIFVSCMVSAIVTEIAAKQIIKSNLPMQKKVDGQTRVMATISNPATINNLVMLSKLVKSSDYKTPIYLLNVVKDDDELEKNSSLQKRVDDISEAYDVNIEYVARIDLNVSAGIVRASKELRVSTVMMGWNGSYSAKQWIFGSILDGVLFESTQQVIVSNANESITRISSINVLVLPMSEFEATFSEWLKTIFNMAQQTSARVNFIVSNSDVESFEHAISNNVSTMKYTIETSIDWNDGFEMLCDDSSKKLPIIVSARKGAISYKQRVDQIPKLISRRLRRSNFVLIFPAKDKRTLPDSHSYFVETSEVVIED